MENTVNECKPLSSYANDKYACIYRARTIIYKK